MARHPVRQGSCAPFPRRSDDDRQELGRDDEPGTTKRSEPHRRPPFLDNASQVGQLVAVDSCRELEVSRRLRGVDAQRLVEDLLYIGRRAMQMGRSPRQRQAHDGNLPGQPGTICGVRNVPKESSTGGPRRHTAQHFPEHLETPCPAYHPPP